MRKGKLYISCGIPGSGKSTFLKANKGKDEVIISRDDIRFSLLKEGEEYFSRENEVFKKFITQITNSINLGYNTYADATHLNNVSREKLLRALDKAGCKPSATEVIFFDVPLDVCLARNEKRKNTKTYVPRGVIRRMFNQLTYPIEFPTIWLVDKDGNVSKGE